ERIEVIVIHQRRRRTALRLCRSDNERPRTGGRGEGDGDGNYVTVTNRPTAWAPPAARHAQQTRADQCQRHDDGELNVAAQEKDHRRACRRGRRDHHRIRRQGCERPTGLAPGGNEEPTGKVILGHPTAGRLHEIVVVNGYGVGRGAIVDDLRYPPPRI